MQRLGKNIGKYFGEGIDIHRYLSEVEEAAKLHGWAIETFSRTESGPMFAFKKSVPDAGKNFYLSAGIHGDEPAGPLAILQLLRENRWPTKANIWILPCLNPTGFMLNSRENVLKIDLNRQYLNTEADEIRAHIRWLDQQPKFDVCMCLHEDWESNGFYLYQLNPDGQPSLAPAILKNVAEVCPIDMAAEIEGREAVGGLISPNLDPRDRPQWPEAFYLITHKTRLSYTVEAPSDFELATRVAAEAAAVRAVLDSLP